MTKIVYNKYYGGFSLSYKAYKWLIEHGLEDKYLNREYNDKHIESRKYVEIIYEKSGNGNYWVRDTKTEQHHTEDELNKICMLVTPDIPRHHPLLIQCVEELGSEVASGPCSKLAITEISSKIYRIDEYCGKETVIEPELDNYIIIA